MTRQWNSRQVLADCEQIVGQFEEQLKKDRIWDVAFFISLAGTIILGLFLLN